VCISDEDWDEMYQELVAFKEKHGHINVEKVCKRLTYLLSLDFWLHSQLQRKEILEAMLEKRQTLAHWIRAQRHNGLCMGNKRREAPTNSCKLTKLHMVTATFQQDTLTIVSWAHVCVNSDESAMRCHLNDVNAWSPLVSIGTHLRLLGSTNTKSWWSTKNEKATAGFPKVTHH
jgi:hypothetical protein